MEAEIPYMVPSEEFIPVAVGLFWIEMILSKAIECSLQREAFSGAALWVTTMHSQASHVPIMSTRLIQNPP